MDSPNCQFGTQVEYKDGDRGTGAWAIKPGPDEVPEVPAVPGSVVLSEDFEGTIWSEITEVSGTWVTTTTHSNSAATSYTNPDIDDGESASFTIQNDAFDAQLSFWLRTDTETGFDKFRVFVDGVEVYSESGFNDWHRVAIPTGFGFLFEFRYTKDFSASTAADACWVDDIVLGSLDTPAVPGVPARPFVYTSLKMTEDGERLAVEDAAAEASLDAIEVRMDVQLSSRASEATLSAIEATINSPVRFARINLLLLGDTTVVAAAPGKKIRVLSYMLTTQTANAAVQLQFKSGALTVLGEIQDIDGLYPVQMAGGILCPLFETALGEPLVLNVSAVKIVKGHLSYVEVG